MLPTVMIKMLFSRNAKHRVGGIHAFPNVFTAFIAKSRHPKVTEAQLTGCRSSCMVNNV